jgi:hypothetical protein
MKGLRDLCGLSRITQQYFNRDGDNEMTRYLAMAVLVTGAERWSNTPPGGFVGVKIAINASKEIEVVANDNKVCRFDPGTGRILK